MRFLVDENIPSQLGRFLAGLGHDVLIIRESQYRRASDSDLWRLAANEDRVIITHDHDFPLLGVAARPAGLILLRPHDNRPTAIEQLFRDFWTGVEEGVVRGHIITVQPGRYRCRPLR